MLIVGIVAVYVIVWVQGRIWTGRDIEDRLEARLLGDAGGHGADSTALALALVKDRENQYSRPPDSDRRDGNRKGGQPRPGDRWVLVGNGPSVVQSTAAEIVTASATPAKPDTDSLLDVVVADNGLDADALGPQPQPTSSRSSSVRRRPLPRSHRRRTDAVASDRCGDRRDRAGEAQQVSMTGTDILLATTAAMTTEAFVQPVARELTRRGHRLHLVCGDRAPEVEVSASTAVVAMNRGMSPTQDLASLRAWVFASEGDPAPDGRRRNPQGVIVGVDGSPDHEGADEGVRDPRRRLGRIHRPASNASSSQPKRRPCPRQPHRSASPIRWPA